MVFNRLGAGRKVYGQGSYAPTKGPVAPTGYVQREIKRRNQQALGQPVGNDGESDRRTGRAANMLDNRGRQAQALGPAQALSQSQMKSFNKGNKQGGKKGPVTSGPKSPANPTASVNTQAAPATPTVNINPTGQLQLPYGSEFANMALDAQMGFDAQMLELQQSEQEQSLAYQQQTNDLEKGYKDQQLQSLNSNAGTGTAFSSAYGVDVNEDAGNYNNMKNNLNSENELFKSGSLNRRNAAKNNLNAMLQRAYNDYANSLADDAGNLGFGTDGAEDIPSGGSSGGGQSSGGKSSGGNKNSKGNKNNSKNKSKPKNWTNSKGETAQVKGGGPKFGNIVKQAASNLKNPPTQKQHNNKGKKKK